MLLLLLLKGVRLMLLLELVLLLMALSEESGPPGCAACAQTLRFSCTNGAPRPGNETCRLRRLCRSSWHSQHRHDKHAQNP